jgi:type IV secretory pathway VirB9-like protein
MKSLDTSETKQAMTFRALLLTSSILALGACATGQEAPPIDRGEPVVVEGPTVYQNVPVAVPTPFELPADSKPSKVKSNPVSATVAANTEGLVVPSPNDFIGAVYQPPYDRDFWYTLYVAAGDQTDVEFAPGEVLRSMSCPDGGVIFSLTPSTFGPEGAEVDQVHIKAKRAGARMQCTFNTSFGPYRVRVISGKTTKHVAIRWQHPGPTLVEISHTDRKRVAGNFAICGAGSDDRYKLSGDLAEWGLRQGDVSTDGKLTCIKFPATTLANGGPVAFLVDEDGTRRQGNPSVIGNYYVFDGVQKQIELRLGARAVLAEKGN